jgi:hypothetical protein
MALASWPARQGHADHEACVEMFSVLHAARRELLVPATAVAEVGYLLASKLVPTESDTPAAITMCW